MYEMDDSVAEFIYSVWDDACTGDYRNTLGNIQNPPTYKIQMQTPSQSWNIKLGRTHAHGGVGVSW